MLELRRKSEDVYEDKKDDKGSTAHNNRRFYRYGTIQERFY